MKAEPKTLKVRARGAVLVHDHTHQNANPRKFIGRQWVTVDGLSALAPTYEDSTVPNCAEFRQAVKEGSLWAADEDTAEACGVGFDEDFGDE